MVYLVCVVLLVLVVAFLVALDRSQVGKMRQEWEDWNG